MPPRITRKSYRPRASDRTMVGIFCNRTACRIRNRRRRHDSNMDRRKKRTPRASQHYMGWRDGQISLLLPVAGEIFLLTLPFIERAYRTSEVLVRHMSDYATYEELRTDCFCVRCEHYFDFGNASQLTISVSGSDTWDAAKLATTNFLPSPVTS